MRRSFLFRHLPSLSSVYGSSFSVTERAWRRISAQNASEGFPNDRRFLRLAIDSGGCHGYVYKFAFEENPAIVPGEDIVIAEADVVSSDSDAFSGAAPSPRVVVDKLSATKMEKAVVDYHSELKGSAFVVVGNELVDHTCACAMSFSVRKKKDTSGGK